MHKKKMKSVLKGVLVAGTAVGGAAVMTEADVVYGGIQQRFGAADF